MTVLNLQIAAGADDGRETGAGVVELTSATGVIMPASSAGYWAALRFLNVTIPEKATVSAAVLSLNFYDTSNDSPDVDIYAEDADTSAALVETDTNISARTRTTAKTTWTATNQNTGWITSPDILAPIQEVIDRDGWSSGNALTLLLDARSVNNSIRFRSYENDTSLAAKLDITYTDGGTQTITIAASADDAHEASGGAVSTSAQSMDVDGVGDLMGMRFPAVNIPPGATITTAYINIYTNDAGRDSPNVTIKGQVNAAAFTTGTNNLSSRTMTTASVQWVATDIGTGAYEASPSLTTILQEIVNDGSWARGNAAGIFLIQNGSSGWLRVAALDHTTDPPPQLVLEWSLAAPPISGSLSATQAGDTLTAEGDVKLAGSLSATQAANTVTATGALAIEATATITAAGNSLSATGKERKATVGASATSTEVLGAGFNDAFNGETFYLDDTAISAVSFDNIPLPPNARVTDARLEVYGNASSDSAALIRAEADAAPAALTANDFDIANRSPLTTASAAWEPGTQTNVSFPSPNLAAIFNELTALPGWTRGASDVVLVLTWENGSLGVHGLIGANPPRLIVEWEPSGYAAPTQTDNTLDAAGQLATVTTEGALDATQDDNTVTAAAGLRVAGAATLTQDDQTATATGALPLAGSLDVTQAGDTAEATAALTIQATATITAGDDTLSAAGAAGLAGALDTAQAGDTLTAAAALTIHGSLDVTADGDSLDAAGQAGPAPGAGVMIATQDANSLSASAALALAATATITAGNDTLSATATISLSGAATIAQDDQTLEAAASSVFHGAAELTQADNSLSATGTSPRLALADIDQAGDTLDAAGSSPRYALAELTQDDNTTATAAALTIRGALGVTVEDDVLTAAGTVETIFRYGNLDATQDAHTVTAAAQLRVSATAAITQAGNTLEAAGASAFHGAAALAQAGDTLVGAATISLSATADVTAGGDSLSASATLAIVGQLDAVQADNTLDAAGTTATVALGSLEVTQDDNTLAAAAILALRATAGIVQAGDTLEAAGGVATHGAAALIQAGNTLAAAGALATHGAAIITQAGDSLAAAGGVAIVGAVNVTAGGDSLAAHGGLDLIFVFFVGSVAGPGRRGTVHYPTPRGTVRTAGDIENR